jgi:hypothetical protein
MPKADPLTVSDVLQKAYIALDNYDDVFSDFDPSPYPSRLLSDDFLKELSRRYAETRKGNFVVTITLPAALRADKTEVLVKRRIKDHFRNRQKSISKSIREKVVQGGVRIALGLVISLFLFLAPQLSYLPLLTIFSVLTWFFLWSGFDNVFNVSARLYRKEQFYEKMMKADYNFMSEEEVVNSLQTAKDDQKSQENSG